MTIPNLFLGWLLSSLMGLIFHILRGGRVSRMLLYLSTAWVSFFAGHFIGGLLGLDIWSYGTLHLFPALLATIIGLIAASILAGPEKPARRKKTH
jgi:hypothetical protein